MTDVNAKTEIDNLLAEIRKSHAHCSQRRSEKTSTEGWRSYYNGACWSYALVIKRLRVLSEGLAAQEPDMWAPPVPMGYRVENRHLHRWLAEVEVVPPGWEVVRRDYISMDNSVVVRLERKIYS